MESLTSIYAEEDVVKNLEESARMQRAYANYFDLVVVDESHDQTYREVMAGVYRRAIFKIRPNILIGQKKLRLRPKDRSRSRLSIYLIF